MESVDLESITGQIGTGIIKISDQTVIKTTGQIDGNKMHTVFEIYKNSSRCFAADQPLKKVTIQAEGKAYQLSSDGQNIYAVLLESKQ